MKPSRSWIVVACAAALIPCAASSAGAPSLSALLAAYSRAIADAGAQPIERFETSGSVNGAALNGSFHTWQDSERAREDETLGPRSQSTLRLGERVFYRNADGNVREFTGIMLRRDRTARFIDSGEFARSPERCVVRGRATIGGRVVDALDVTAPGGETETLYLDDQTGLPARVGYDDDDGRTTVDFSDWRTIAGHRFPFRAIVSDGDHPYDVVQTTERVVFGTFDPAVFTPFVARIIEMTAPQTLQLEARDGHLYVPVRIAGRRYTFLLDSGAQNILVDARVAREAALNTVGALEASGAQRTGGLQLARLDALQVGDGTLRDLVVTVLDLRRSTSGAFGIDGILGYPFFAETMLRLDPANATMTFGPPGSFAPSGRRLGIETDRGFPEVRVRLNGALDATFLVDTGNASEVLLYKPFVDRHPAIVPPSVTAMRRSYGVGGSATFYSSSLDRLDFGGISLYHAEAQVMLATRGAFADRFDAGNLGLGLLKNLVVTFDESANVLYVEPGPRFDDGRRRV